MVDRPIIFSAPMVRALLAGRKTQTRRLVSPQPERSSSGRWWDWTRKGGGGAHADDIENFKRMLASFMPYAVGDRLYVREAHRLTDCPCTEACRLPGNVYYEAGENDEPFRYMQNRLRPSIHMPRWASRLTLFVERVRVERLQDISEEDAVAEGILEYEPTEEGPAEFSYADGGDIWNNARSAFEALWQSLHGRESWDANPFVIALTFSVHHGNIDSLPRTVAGGVEG